MRDPLDTNLYRQSADVTSANGSKANEGNGDRSRPGITSATPDLLAEMIDFATRRLVLAAPGLSNTVADAVVRAWRRLPPESCAVILDADPDVCRLGYGTFDAPKRLQEAALVSGQVVRHQPGLRIGLLIADDRTLVFSPTPLLIEAGSDSSQPNAIELGVLPGEVAADVGVGAQGEAGARIGREALNNQRIDAMQHDLHTAPPVKFDLARRVRVFTSRFQFVELKMTGCQISRRRVAIPSDLMGLAGGGDVERQFQAHFNLVHEGALEVKSGQRKLTERALLDRRRRLERQFLMLLPGYGSVVLRANKNKLLEEVDKLRADVEAFSKGIKVQLTEMIAKSCSTVVEALLPSVERNPPAFYTKSLGSSPDREILRKLLEGDITRAFGSAEDVLKDMQVQIVFKDLAYESLVDKKFVETARKAMPHVEFLHEEYDAAAADGTGAAE